MGPVGEAFHSDRKSYFRNRIRALIGLAAVAMLLLFLSGCAVSQESDKAIPEASNGVIDLTGWSWEKDGIVPLDGVWRFQWTPGRSGSSGTGVKNAMVETTIRVPGTWGTSETGNGVRIEDQGYGIYQLTIKHAPHIGLLALRVPNVSTAYELRVDGKVVATRGVTGMSAADSVPYQQPAIVFFDGDDDTTELTLSVANYDHRRGGIRTAIVVGDYAHIEKQRTMQAAQELIVLGCLLMIGFYHFGLFVMRRKEKANLMFALLCLFVSLRMGVIGEGYLVQWIDPLDWAGAIRVEYVAFVMAGWSGFGFFRTVYPYEIKRYGHTLSTGIATVLIAVLFVVKPLTFTSWILVYQLYILFFSSIVLVALVFSARKCREGAWLSLVGVAGLVLTIVNDMLFYSGWWRSVDLLPFGLLFLIILNSFIMSKRSSSTFEEAERMSRQLKEWNNSLEEKIEGRTAELQRSYATLEEAKRELERVEQSRTQLVSNISHDLRTPITLLRGYLEALKDNVISDPVKRDHTIRSMLAKVEGLNALIQDLFDLSVLEARKVELTLEYIPLSEWMQRLTEQYSLEMQEKGIGFASVIDVQGCPGAKVLVDIRRMDRVFANIVYNAIRHTPQGGLIRVAMQTFADRSEMEVSVSDSGGGIDPDDLPFIFDRFYKKDKSRHSSSGGSGLGLSIAKEIVELHGGSISACNLPGGGSEFRIVMPLSA
ncbi:sensor histidine kinase [Cohnella soli]|uniref:histidine kinase n=1 Tax=Cohnella soli TaxID=425005 RepID=A0ABW0HT66_9BACL